MLSRTYVTSRICNNLRPSNCSIIAARNVTSFLNQTAHA